MVAGITMTHRAKSSFRWTAPTLAAQERGPPRQNVRFGHTRLLPRLKTNHRIAAKAALCAAFPIDNDHAQHTRLALPGRAGARPSQGKSTSRGSGGTDSVGPQPNRHAALAAPEVPVERGRDESESARSSQSKRSCTTRAARQEARPPIANGASGCLGGPEYRIHLTRRVSGESDGLQILKDARLRSPLESLHFHFGLTVRPMGTLLAV